MQNTTPVSRIIVLVVLLALFATACPPKAVRALDPPFRGRATVGFAERTAPLNTCIAEAFAFSGTCLYHSYSAVDWHVAYGTPVRAMEAGRVFMQGEEIDGEGDPGDPPVTTTTVPPSTTPPASTTTEPPATTTAPPSTTTTLATVELDAEPVVAYERNPGMFVVLDHRLAHPGYQPPEFTRYSHLSSFSWAAEGMWVKQGQIIGYAGNTQSPSVHVHVDAFYDLEYGPTGGFNEYDHQAALGRFCWTDAAGRVHIRWPSQLDWGQRVTVRRGC